MNICAMCRWVTDTDKHFVAWQCHLPRGEYTDYVTGHVYPVYQAGRYCEELRKAGWLEARISRLCGKEGRYWEAKND